MKRPFGRGPTTLLRGLTNHGCQRLTNWDDPPSIYPNQAFDPQLQSQLNWTLMLLTAHFLWPNRNSYTQNGATKHFCKNAVIKRESSQKKMPFRGQYLHITFQKLFHPAAFVVASHHDFSSVFFPSSNFVPIWATFKTLMTSIISADWFRFRDPYHRLLQIWVFPKIMVPPNHQF